eukprot:TRINITY_DN77951_c0_g1_i1.p1 TRINITY_DN77951_c0_g1~~TRINITY_DN77951_c0_g1_i1.p1  ORF type:complete len:243 (+),score=30.28 TRINITY_DN77951_c0_g1_i1:111-839(+)
MPPEPALVTPTGCFEIPQEGLCKNERGSQSEAAADHDVYGEIPPAVGASRQDVGIGREDMIRMRKTLEALQEENRRLLRSQAKYQETRRRCEELHAENDRLRESFVDVSAITAVSTISAEADCRASKPVSAEEFVKLEDSSHDGEQLKMKLRLLETKAITDQQAMDDLQKQLFAEQRTCAELRQINSELERALASHDPCAHLPRQLRMTFRGPSAPTIPVTDVAVQRQRRFAHMLCDSTPLD